MPTTVVLTGQWMGNRAAGWFSPSSMPAAVMGHFQILSPFYFFSHTKSLHSHNYLRLNITISGAVSNNFDLQILAMFLVGFIITLYQLALTVLCRIPAKRARQLASRKQE